MTKGIDHELSWSPSPSRTEGSPPARRSTRFSRAARSISFLTARERSDRRDATDSAEGADRRLRPAAAASSGHVRRASRRAGTRRRLHRRRHHRRSQRDARVAPRRSRPTARRPCRRNSKPLPSSVPILIMGGELDSLTPEPDVEKFGPTLGRNVRVIKLANAVHVSSEGDTLSSGPRTARAASCAPSCARRAGSSRSTRAARRASPRCTRRVPTRRCSRASRRRRSCRVRIPASTHAAPPRLPPPRSATPRSGASTPEPPRDLGCAGAASPPRRLDDRLPPARRALRRRRPGERQRPLASRHRRGQRQAHGHHPGGRQGAGRGQLEPAIAERARHGGRRHARAARPIGTIPGPHGPSRAPHRRTAGRRGRPERAGPAAVDPVPDRARDRGRALGLHPRHAGGEARPRRRPGRLPPAAPLRRGLLRELSTTSASQPARRSRSAPSAWCW